MTIADCASRTLNGAEELTPAEPVEPALIRKKELASRLSVSTSTIDNWMSRRLIPFIRIGPRFCLYEFDAVFEAIKGHYEVKPVARD
jgi:excisionase family DNA binding protein